MAEALEFTNVINVLERFGNEVIEAYRSKLISGNINTSEMKLYNSLELSPIKTDKGHFEVSINLNWYWKLIEEGLRGEDNPSSPYKAPQWRKAFPHILNWIIIKPIPIEAARTYNGSLPTVHTLDEDAARKGAAAAISRTLERKGTEPKPILKESVDETFKGLKKALSEALRLDMASAIVSIFGSSDTYTI